MRALVVVGVVVGLMFALLWGFQRRLVYLPDPTPPGPAERAVPGGRDVTLQTADGLTLGAWFMPARVPDRGLTVLVANGNAGNRSLRVPLAAALAQAGLSVLLFDYRGFGGNRGAPTEQGLLNDAQAARRFLLDEAGVSPDRLLYYGESLGAAVVARLAVEAAPAGLVLRSPFTDLASVARVHYPYLPIHAVLLRDRFPVARLLSRVTAPTTVLYGTRDSIVPPRQSRAVAAAAAGPTEVVALAGADHNDRVLLDGPELIRAVVDLADRVSGRAPE